MKIKPFREQNEFIIIPNDLIDEVIPRLVGIDWTVLISIMRHRRELSVGEIKAHTGLTDDYEISQSLHRLRVEGLI